MGRIPLGRVVVIAIAMSVSLGLAEMTGWDAMVLPVLLTGAALVAVLLWLPARFRLPVSMVAGGLATACAALMGVALLARDSGLIRGWVLFFGMGVPAAALALLWAQAGSQSRNQAVTTVAGAALAVLVISALYIFWMLAGFS